MYGDGQFRSYFGAIAVPILDAGNGTMSNVTHDWANATAALSGGLAITVMRLQIRNQRVDLAKERLAEMAIANNCEFVLFIDDDVLVPNDALLKMIRMWKSDNKYKIISGVYFSKSDPPMPLIFNGNLVGSYWDWKTTDIIKADGAGAGCLFVDCNVLRKLPKPWFSCDYFFEDPRSEYDVQKWQLADQLVNESMKGPEANPEVIKGLEASLAEVADKMKKAQNGYLDPNLYKNKRSDGSTTEDLYFFKKAKEYLGDEGQLWVDCSIQCQHQDKRTGRVWGLNPDMPQARPRYEGSSKPGDKIVLDLGAGTANYWIEEGKPIKVDLDPKTNPDILADVRWLPLEDCFADQVNASHVLEHISFHQTMATLKEWVRVLKVGGRLVIVVPNLKWAALNIMNDIQDDDLAHRSMFFFYSQQKGDGREAADDIHKAGFTPQSMKGILERLGILENIQVYTSEGNYGNWQDEDKLRTDGLGYNIIAIATKAKHKAAISLKVSLKAQEAVQSLIGEKANLPVLKLPEPKKEPIKKKRFFQRKKK